LAAYFLDSSALVKRYARETGTAWMSSLFRIGAGHRLYVSRITGVEVAAALTRKLRGGQLSTGEATRARGRLRRDISMRLRITEVTPVMLTDAMNLAEKHGLRGYDAVQLGAALEVNSRRVSLGTQPLTLITGDDELLQAAAAEGLPTDNPNAH
jgi:predicted nucleic acid-binding protein